MSIKKAVTRAVAAVVVAVCAFANANAETNFYEYVEAAGAKYNTGYFPNASSVISFKGMFVEQKSSEKDTKLFAAYRNGSSVATQVGIKDGSGRSLSVSCWTRGGSDYLGSLDNIVEGWACMLTGVISNTTRKCVINGQSLDMSSVETGSTWAPELALHGSVPATYKSKTRLYYVSISEGGLPVRDYRPCSVDGVAGYFDLVTGTFGGNSNFTIGGNRLYRLTAVAVPADAGSVVGPRDQFVSAEETPAVLKAVPANEKCVFEGWRYAGTTEIFSTEPVLQLGAPTADVSVEAVFSFKKIAYSFDLGDAGVFTENGQSTITVEYDYGATPALPAYTLNEGCYFQRWNRAVPATVGAEDLPFVAVAVTPETKVIRVDPAAPSTGEGKTWATALNSFEDAADLAKHCTAEVWLAGGTNKLAAVVSLWNNAVIRGGFAAVDGPSDAEQLAARDGVARPSALETASGNTTGLLNQKTALQGVQTLDGLTLVQTVGKKTFECTVTAQVDFTNCHFTARGNVPLNVVDCSSSGNSTFRFFDCRITNLISTSVSRNGLMDFKSGVLVFERCRFEGNSSKGDGVVRSSNAVATYVDCVFLRNSVADSSGGQGAACASGSDAKFTRCRFLWNTAVNDLWGIVQFKVMEDCLVLSNTVSRTDTSTAGAVLLKMGTTDKARLLRTTIAENVIKRNQPGLAAGTTVWSHIISPADAQNNDSYRAYVNLTIASNRVDATLAEGVTHEVATIVWGDGTSNNSGSKYGGVANCTFYNNDVTAEVVDKSPGKTIDCYLFNTICWNDRADYRPLLTTVQPTEGRGFRLYDCILKNYEACEAIVYAAEGVTAEDPLLKPTPQIEVNGHWTFPVAKWSKAFHWGRQVTVDDNLVFAVPSVYVEGSKWQVPYCAWCTGANAPQDVASTVDITDICGRGRPVDCVVIGSTQECRKRGLAILLR